MKAALEQTLGEGTLVLCHISHVYETGCSLYFTVATKESADPLPQWLAAKAAASDAIVAAGATITHHHAVGTDHKPWLVHEIGELGASVLRAVKADLDPTGVLNPGVAHPVTPASRFTFLVNPASGGGAAPAAVVPVARILRDAGASVDVTYSPGPRAMGALVDAAVARGRRRGLGRRRRDALVARRPGLGRGRHPRRRTGRPRQRLRPHARAAVRPGRGRRRSCWTATCARST